LAVAIGQEIYERWRKNKCLDPANKDFLLPRGLFALTVTYNSGGSEQTQIGTKTIMEDLIEHTACNIQDVERYGTYKGNAVGRHQTKRRGLGHLWSMQ